MSYVATRGSGSDISSHAGVSGLKAEMQATPKNLWHES